MASAERCRVLLVSRTSKTLRRGEVTLRPALRRSWLSTFHSFPARGYDVRRPDYDRSPTTPPPVSILDLLRRAVALAAIALTLGACVYRINIQQGNLLEEGDVDLLTVGMERG